MNARVFLGGRVTLYPGDCLEAARALPDGSVDSVVTDPPYALASIVKRFGSENAAPARSNGPTGVFGRGAAGFMGKKWDTGDRAFASEFWAEIYRVLKPGGHVLAMGGTRTYHRLATAIEEAGFEIRDQFAWAYGSGFPKSHNVAKGIDKKLGAEGRINPKGDPVRRIRPGADQHKDGSWEKLTDRVYQPGEYVPATEDAAAFEGWGTAVKPAWEPICLARKPLIGTVAENVLRHGTGALNIDGCRVGMSQDDAAYISERIGGFNGTRSIGGNGAYSGGETMDRAAAYDASKGRFPANIIHDGSEEVLHAFPLASGAQAPVTGDEPSGHGFSGTVYGAAGAQGRLPSDRRDGGGSAARFFYTAKADADDRLGSEHPTVKPLDLMQWLVRLITPKGGTVLDPFAGTGTTGEAAWREGFNAILIEREEEYQADIARRMELALSPMKRSAVAKSKNRLLGGAGLPLFGAEAAE